MTSQASKPNPYVGPRAFQDGETLYGRDREVKKLLNLFIAERIVLLYSPSGAGKTSLIQAALIPKLREEGFQVLPVIRVGLEPAPDLELPATANRYILSTLLSLEEDLPAEQQTPLTELAGMDLSTYLDQRQPETGETNANVLIFDQFEEILTVDPTDQAAKAEFFAQLGKALRPRDRWVLFAMREEYPAGLDPYLRPVPTRLSTTFRLELLGAKAAHQAMQEPACQAGVPFTDTAAQKLIDDLRRVQVQQPDGTTAEQPGLYIEPVQLQVVCYRLWEKLPDDASEIQETDIRQAGDVDSALAGYYADRVKATAQATGVRERTIREWFDKQLITEQGIRGQVLRGPEQSQGLEDKAIEPLVDAHLVRAENRRGATWYELAHDRLVKPVKEDNADWREKHLSALQRRAALWESQSRFRSGLLLRDKALEEVEHWAAVHQNELTSTERDFLAACREARTQAQKERWKNHFIQGLAIVTTIIMCVAGYFFLQAKQAENQARQAEQTAKDEAVRARQSEKKAEERRKEAERQSAISLARALSFQSLQEQEHYQDTRAALLARQAYLLNQKYQGGVLSQIDRALRSVLDALRFRCIVLVDHDEEVSSVAFSPDGQTLASGSEDTAVRLWDLTTPDAEPRILHGHDAPVLSVAFSPDGQLLASGSSDTTVRLWDLATPDATPIILRGHENSVLSVAFSPDGQTLASGSSDTTVRLWDVSTALNTSLTTSDATPIILLDHESWVWSVAFSPDGQTLASGSSDTTVRLWDLTTPDAEPKILHGHESIALSVAFSPDGQMLASGSEDSNVRLWDLSNPTTVPTVLRGHQDRVKAVAFSPDGHTLASGSFDKSIRLWDLTTPDATPIILRGHEHNVLSVVFSPNGQRLASGSEDSTVRLWDVSTGLNTGLTTPDATPIILLSPDKAVYSVAFSPDGWILASSLPVAFSPDGETLASGSADGTVRLLDLTMPRSAPITLSGHESIVLSIAFSPNGRILASGSRDKTVRLWDLTTPEAAPTILLGHNDEVWSVAFSPDGQSLASGSADNTVRLWDLTTPDAASTILRGHERVVLSVAFSPNGQRLASGSVDKTVRLWDLAMPEAAPTILRGHEGDVRSVVFSLDGQTLASGSEDTTVRLWDLTMLETAPIVLRGHEDGVWSVAFSPDGRILASGSRDKTVRNWDWRTERLAEQVCEKVWRNLTMEEWRQFVSPDTPYERTCPNLPIHPSVLEAGRDLAKEGDVERSVAIFQRALELDPGLDFVPEVEVNKWKAQGLVEKGEKLAKDEGKIQNAIAAYTEAQMLDPTLKISADTWGDLCWYGSLWEHATDVMNACGQAVEQASDTQKDRFRDRRGVARALTGNIEGAIEDLQIYVDWTKRQEWASEDWAQKLIVERQSWIEALRAGENPFTPEVLERLRSE